MTNRGSSATHEMSLHNPRLLILLAGSEWLRGGHGGLSLLGQRRKACCVLHCDVSQDLAVEFDAGYLEPVHELAVADAVQLGSGADADDPDGAILALLLLAAGISKLESALYGFLRC